MKDHEILQMIIDRCDEADVGYEAQRAQMGFERMGKRYGWEHAVIAVELALADFGAKWEDDERQLLQVYLLNLKSRLNLVKKIF